MFSKWQLNNFPVLWLIPPKFSQNSHPYHKHHLSYAFRYVLLFICLPSVLTQGSLFFSWHCLLVLIPNGRDHVCEVTQLCSTLCSPLDCSLPDSSVHGIFQAIVLKCHFLLQGIFLTQGLNPGLPHCRQMLDCLNQTIVLSLADKDGIPDRQCYVIWADLSPNILILLPGVHENGKDF